MFDNSNNEASTIQRRFFFGVQTSAHQRHKQGQYNAKFDWHDMSLLSLGPFLIMRCLLAFIWLICHKCPTWLIFHRCQCSSVQMCHVAYFCSDSFTLITILKAPVAVTAVIVNSCLFISWTLWVHQLLHPSMYLLARPSVCPYHFALSGFFG